MFSTIRHLVYVCQFKIGELVHLGCCLKGVTLMFKKMLFAVACGSMLTASLTAHAEQLIMGTESTYPPFEFTDTKNSSEVIGFDIDMIRLIGQKAGFTVKVVSMGFDALIPAILSRQIDIAGAAITITEERAKRVFMTDPYYDSGLSILVRKADKDVYKTDADLKNKLICGQIGNSGMIYAKTIPGAQTKTFNTMNEAYMELRNKGCEAVIGDRPTIGHFMASNPKNKEIFSHQEKVLNVEQFGFAVSKKNPKLLERMNKALAEAKKDGSYQALITKWFGE